MIIKMKRIYLFIYIYLNIYMETFISLINIDIEKKALAQVCSGDFHFII